MMKDKKIKITIIIGIAVIVIIGGYVVWASIYSKGKSVSSTSTQNITSSSSEATIKAWLAENSGNKGYDSWSAKKKADFRAAQLKILESLKK